MRLIVAVLLLLLVLLALPVIAAAEEEYEEEAAALAWSIVPPPTRRRLRPLREEEEETPTSSTTTLLQLHFDAIAGVFRRNNKTSSSSPERMQFQLPGRAQPLSCTLLPSSVFPAALQEKYPGLVQRTGRCTDNSTTTVRLNLDLESPRSFSAAFWQEHRGEWVYVDRDNSTAAAAAAAADKYVLYRKRDAAFHGRRPAFSCGQTTTTAAAPPSSHYGRGLSSVPEEYYYYSTATLRIALVANRGYSNLAGNSTTAVLNSFASLLGRINGIYSRELGVSFQLVEHNDRLLCVRDGSAFDDGLCPLMLPNAPSSTVMANAQSFIASRGVPPSAYDLGHVLTWRGNSVGGVAVVGGLCMPGSKAKATTAVSSAVGDAFAVDYFAHEIGHQLMGQHTFGDCGSAAESSSSASPTAVEPGSGSTIMAYAGLCGPRNLQLHSDAYFHAANLPIMSEFVRRQLLSPTCGINKRVLPERDRVVIHSPPPPPPTVDDVGIATCELPLGSPFMLTGSASAQAKYFQWEHMGAAEATAVNSSLYLDEGVPQFRSWKPVRGSPTRFFPNLRFMANVSLWQDVALNKYAERLPVAPARLSFRFVARSTPMATTADASDELGDCAVRDLVVRFGSNGAAAPAVKFANQTRTALLAAVLVAGEPFTFEWTGGGGGNEDFVVEVLAAVMTEDNRDNNYADLAWELVGSTNSTTTTGTWTLPFAAMARDREEEITVGFLITSTSINGSMGGRRSPCATFDFVAGVRLRVAPSGAVAAPNDNSTALLLPVFIDQPAVVQRMSACTVSLGAPCHSTFVAGYSFVAPYTAVFTFTAGEGGNNTCKDITLFAERYNDTQMMEAATTVARQRSALSLLVSAGQNVTHRVIERYQRDGSADYDAQYSTHNFSADNEESHDRKANCMAHNFGADNKTHSKAHCSNANGETHESTDDSGTDLHARTNFYWYSNHRYTFNFGADCETLCLADYSIAVHAAHCVAHIFTTNSMAHEGAKQHSKSRVHHRTRHNGIDNDYIHTYPYSEGVVD